MSPVRCLTRPYPARGGVPVIRAVDDAVFTRRYYARCMACGFCRDACCAHGVDVDEAVVRAILGQADRIEGLVGVPRDEWFTGAPDPDPEVPGGASRRTTIRDGYCVFHDPRGRGCLLHGYALATGQDYHTLKPMVSTLFPLTFESGTLVLSDELEDGTLVCAGSGPTAYDAVRGELAYYFGHEMVGELDGLAELLGGHSGRWGSDDLDADVRNDDERHDHRRSDGGAEPPGGLEAELAHGANRGIQ